MNDKDQKLLGKTLWNIADQLRGAMNADDFRDYMLAFLFLRYLSDNYEAAARKELGPDYPELSREQLRAAGDSTPLRNPLRSVSSSSSLCSCANITIFPQRY